MDKITTKDNYWISPNAVSIFLNALGDCDRIQCSCASGANILCYVPGVTEGDGLVYDVGHKYKHWPLSISPTYFNDHQEKYVYVAIPRLASTGVQAQFVFPSEKLDVYGVNAADEQVGDDKYFFIWTQGIISSSGDDGQTRRTWLQEPDWGWLDSDEQYSEGGDSTWWRWNPVTDTVEFLKTISSAVFEYIKATTAEIKNLYVTGFIDAIQAKIDDIRSHNYSPGMLDGSGFILTSDNGEGSSELEVDFLKVRKKATFMELEVRKETFVGGNQNYSPAGSVIYRVDYMDEHGQALGYTKMKVPFLLKGFSFLGKVYNYAARKRIQRQLTPEEWLQVHHMRCYLIADDGTTATRNWWQVGDQPCCKAFNKALSSKDKRRHTYDADGTPMEDPATPAPKETSYYWRLCSNTGSEKLDDGYVYDYIDMPYEGWYGYTDEDRRSFRDSGSGIPVAGDTIVCMGNRYDKERMNMISLATCGDDENPPSIKLRRGIHAFNFDNTLVAEMSPEKFEVHAKTFRLFDDSGYNFPVPFDRGEYVVGNRYRWYDRVSWIGSIWLCQVLDTTIWEDAYGNEYVATEVTDIVEGEGNFTYHVSGLPGMAEGQEITGTDHYYRQGKSNGRTVYNIKLYTYTAPSDLNDLWLKEVSKGTEIVDDEIRYAASLDGVNHPEDDTSTKDPSTVEVPEEMKTRTSALLTSFVSALSPASVPPAGSKTHDYLSKLYYEAYTQFHDGESPYGLPLLYKKDLFPSLTDYYGSDHDTAAAFRALTGILFASVLTELRPDRRDALMAAGYNLGPDKTVFIYKYDFASDQNVARLVGSALCAAMRGLLKTDMAALRTEMGGSLLDVKLHDVAVAPYASYASSYYVQLAGFMPSAPGPYFTGYTDRSVPGIPYDDYDLADHNLQKDLDIYNLVVSDYNLDNAEHHQEVVQAIADKDAHVKHLFGSNRNDQGYSFHPVFGVDTIGRFISDAGATADAVADIFEIGIGSRQALKQGAWDGRRRPGQREDANESKDAPYGVLMNMVIDNIDGHPSGYDKEGDYVENEKKIFANSYPSGHSAGIWTTALFLIELLPHRADLIMKAANVFAMNRQITRYHWNADTIIGRLSGATAAAVIRATKDYAERFDAAKAEVNPGGLWKKTIEETGIKPGQYLWTRRKTYYSDGREPTVEYSVARWGIDGDGIAEIDSYYLGTKNTDLVITADTDTFPLPTDSGWAAADPDKKWFNTFGEMTVANGGVGQMQGWNVWEKTVIRYDLAPNPDGTPRTAPDLVNYKCNRIGQDGQIGMEEYYMLAASDSFNIVFGSASPDYAHIGIRWYNQSHPEAENWRLSDTTPNINTDKWKTTRPSFQEGSANKYLWNFEQSIDGKGTEYATRPVCIGDASRGIAGVIELYAISSSKTPVSDSILVPADINSKNTYGVIPTSGFSDKQVWGDEKYDRAPTEALPYQWNWTRTLYTTPKDASDTKRYTWNGVDYPYEDHYHVSAVIGSRGEDGAGTEYVYKLTNSETAPSNPANPSDRSIDDYVPSGWTDNPSGVSYNNKYEWVSERHSANTGTNGRHMWGDFSTPRLWSHWGTNGQDGDGVEYVYIRTQSLGSAPPSITNSSDTDPEGRTYKDDEYRPMSSAGRCTDDPVGVSADYPYEWVALRTKGTADGKTGVRQWNKYSGQMKLWAKFGKDGAKGDTGDNVVRVDLNNENDSMLYDGAGNLLSGSVVSTAYLYDGLTDKSSSATWSISASGCTASLSGRTITVSAMSSTSGSVTITATYGGKTYSAVLTLKKLVGVDKFDLDLSPSALFLNTSEGWSNGQRAVTVKVMRTPANGATPSAVDPSSYGLAVTVSVGSLSGSGTSRTITITQAQATSNEGTTVTLHKSGDTSKVYDRETVPFNRAKNGDAGSPGHVGRWYYFAGDWKDTEIYKFEATRAPYVRRNNNFYMLDCAAWTSTQQSSSTYNSKDEDPADSAYNQGTPWSPMTSTFKYIITEAIFSAGAHLGSFIFNSDWMLSQHGVVYDSSGEAHVINSRSSYGGYNTSNAYTIFDPSYPNKSKSGTNNFVPNYAVDGKTGNTYLNTLYAKGELTVTNDSNSIKINSSGLEGLWGSDGIRLDSSGLQRKHPKLGWVAMFSKRLVRTVNDSSSAADRTLTVYDDCIISNAQNTDLTITLPGANGAGIDGRTITIQNTGRSTIIKAPSGKYIRTGGQTLSEVHLNNYDRAEFIGYGGYWYGNYMSGF